MGEVLAEEVASRNRGITNRVPRRQATEKRGAAPQKVAAASVRQHVGRPGANGNEGVVNVGQRAKNARGVCAVKGRSSRGDIRKTPWLCFGNAARLVELAVQCRRLRATRLCRRR